MKSITRPYSQDICDKCKFKNEDDYCTRNKVHYRAVIECVSYIKKEGKVN